MSEANDDSPCNKDILNVKVQEMKFIHLCNFIEILYMIFTEVPKCRESMSCTFTECLSTRKRA